MRRQLTTVVAALVTMALAITAMFAVRTAGAASVTPVFVAGNPSCTGLGYDFGFKPQPEPPPSGTYTFPDGVNTVTITSDGTYFNWSSTLGIDAVIVKGGPNANVYVYDPPAESFGDTGLHAPTNSSGGPADISHIEFCYDYEVAVSKTANTTFTRTYSWDIAKTKSSAYDLFTGDSVVHPYQVTVTRTGFVDSAWAVSGSITIQNPAPFGATITGVTDVISPSIGASVNCGVSFPYVLAAGGQLICSYSASLPDGASRTNTATVATSGVVGGGSGTAPVTFGAPTTEVNASVTVSDTNLAFGGPHTVSNTTTFPVYTSTFICDADEGAHTNTATIVETGQTASATVTVNCYKLNVAKDADTSFDRAWSWKITKSADQSNLTLSTGQQFLVNYTVIVETTGSTDSGWAVEGTITINNPAPIGATLISVNDVVSPDIAASVSCGVSFPYVLASQGSLQCSYDAGLPDATSRTNTAAATLQNYSYDTAGSATANGTTDFTGSANVSFSSTPTTKTDDCVSVSDSNPVGPQNVQVCADESPKTFTYSAYVGPYATCGSYSYINVASFVTNTTGSTGSDDHTVVINVPCLGGCTLTQGYWKTHSREGPAPYDDAWQNLGALEEDTSFFLSGQTWYEVFWTAPAGNPYYNLAHQYMAAKLNVLSGASSPATVTDALAAAETLFNTYTPTQIRDLKANNAVRKQFVALASTLDQYNNGLIGPGHCSE